MNISFSWLKKYIDFDLSANETAEVLTSLGLEVASVEERESIRGGLEGLVVGKVLTCVEHPNSDHLHITTVDLGKEWTPESPLQIVCGAPNVAAGQKVVVATVGTTLYSGEESFKIKKGKLRGEVSEGMICSETEIGVGSDSSGILVLPEEVQEGTLARDYFDVKSDTIIEIDITPNRVDATSHYGVARDLYAYLCAHGKPAELRLPELKHSFEELQQGAEPIQLELQAPQACYRYAGIVINDVKVGESPAWLREALEAIGQRSVNNVVDVSNYILFELGQPLHTFDLEQLEGNQVVVRLAKEGETMQMLDESTIELIPTDLVIADAEKPACLAGVFGGLHSGVTETTKNIFLECATFHPTYVRRSARRHGISSDSSFRFERGLDAETIPYALVRATELLIEVTGGKIGSRVYDAYPQTMELAKVTLMVEQVRALTGLDLTEERIVEILEALQIEIVECKEGVLQLRIPRYRYDVTRDVDVIEEILRIHGYNAFPEDRMLKSTLNPETETDRSIKKQQIISEQLVGAGFFELMNNSLSKESYYRTEEALQTRVVVENPLSQDLAVMRMTLLHGGLEAVEFNLNRKRHALRLFEFGNCYRLAKEGESTPLKGYKESYRLGLWMTGDEAPHNWDAPTREVSLFELKATVENVLARLGIQPTEVRCDPLQGDSRFEKGESITLLGGGEVAWWGIVSQAVLKELHDIEVPVYFAELDWGAIVAQLQGRGVTVKPIPKFPAVKRDFALLLDKSVTFGEVERVAKRAERKLLTDMELFDVYEDPKHLPEGKKSYAVSFTLLHEEKTLSDKEIEKAMECIYQALHKELGATLR